MRIEESIYNLVKDVLPVNSKKSVFFAAVAKTSQEVFFYSYFEGIDKPKQCYQMAESGDYDIDENMLDEVFEKLAAEIRKAEKFEYEMTNVVTFVVENAGVKVDFEAYDKNVSLYKIKKEWKNKNKLR